MLPDKWAIKRTKEACKTLNNYFNLGCQREVYTSTGDGWYFHYPNFCTKSGFHYGGHLDTEIRNEYKEISFEDFRRYFLKENIEKSYELW
jgi:hypothetical protein